MSLDKAILHGKEHRKAYCRENGSYLKEISPICRNHGGCPWCQENRLHKNRKKEEGMKIDLKEYHLQSEETEERN